MRMSCNGCRVLRKGCSDDCIIRPCLQWIRNPEAQGNATVFLAKFYGRAGLMNLIGAGPAHLRPAIFRSLLYEACGRIVNPTYGSVGLLWSGSWQHCQAAVEAVLKGAPIAQLPAASYDIRHVAKNHGASAADLHKVAATSRMRFKRAGSGGAGSWTEFCPVEFGRAASHESGSDFTVETIEGSHVSQGEPSGRAEEGSVGLDLTLGLVPPIQEDRTDRFEEGISGDNTCPVELRLAVPN
ncbi:LOB domain-containing protein 41-like [Typha angustifolia]|uniref:LOB domain-containing protein 41-like n=1 Tax=Typha angustifolia TaxID=59011 RepID=UPI003C2E95DC